MDIFFLSDGGLRTYGAAIVVSVIAPLLGIFLVTRRYSYLSDALAHASLAGVAISIVTGWHLIFSAMVTALLAAFSVEEIRYRRRMFGEAALVIFLSGGLAVAAVLLSLAREDIELESLFFGSIEKVSSADFIIIAILGFIVALVMSVIFKELISVSLDEEAAEAGGLPVRFINFVFVTLAAVTVSISIKIVGVMLIGALTVIPVAAAMQLRTGFKKTLLIAIGISVFSVSAGFAVSAVYALSSGGMIVLIALGIFLLTLLKKRD